MKKIKKCPNLIKDIDNLPKKISNSISLGIQIRKNRKINQLRKFQINIVMIIKAREKIIESAIYINNFKI
jgi:hypothetical protein